MIQKIPFLIDNSFNITKKEEQSLNFFWYGFTVYTLFFVLSATESFISPAACQGLQAIGFIVMIFGASGLIKSKIDDPYLQLVFWIYFLYSVSIIFRGAEYDFKSIKLMVFDVSYGAMPYFAPLVLLIPRKVGFYKKIFNILIILGIFFILCVILFYKVLHDPDRLSLISLGYIETFFGLLAYPVSFLLLTYLYHSDKKSLLGLGKINILALVVMLISLFFLIYRARRGSIAMCVSTLACVGMIYISTTKRKMLIILMSVIFIGAVAVFFAGRKTPAMFNFVIDRGDEDTRTGVEEYMYADMTTNDWIIGKGINGKYFCPIIDNVNDATGYRENIETGYLQIILKGGLVSLTLLLLILLPAVYKGLFNSKNVLSKSAAVWIFLWIIYLKPIIGNTFSMHYLIVWIAVGICYSKKIRNMSDITIKSYLQRSN